METVSKKNIKCIFITRYLNRHPRATSFPYDISILTEKFEYEYIMFNVFKNILDPHLMDRLTDLLKRYQITKHTEIVYTKNIKDEDVLYLILCVLRTQIHFKTLKIDHIRIPRRISQFHSSYLDRPAKKVKMAHIQTLWEHIIEDHRCPWITAEIDAKMKLKSNGSYRYRIFRREQFARLGMYYVLVKQHIMLKKKQS